ncbi:GAF domain-containing protein [Geomonas sp.]|uniref:GAF domain-containing protein n=1 Tax=Geomonas sp. TaxID=2651584 RepID=UPI002B49B50D|nr:GAF domain-containing protein [Geomonas sp.]HJV35911.1 GAF domain-containing protein [Geomonas sp.]
MSAQSLELERSRLEAVLDNLPVGVWIADQEGRVVGKNGEADRIWSGTAPLLESMQDYRRHAAWDAGSGRLLRQENHPMAKALATGEPVAPVELKIRRFDGTHGIVLSSAAPVLDRNGGGIGVVGISLEITDRAALEAERKLAEEQIRQQNVLLNGIRRVLASALTAPNEQELAKVCLAVAEEVTESKCGFIGEVCDDGGMQCLQISDPGWKGGSSVDGGDDRPLPGSFKLHGLYGTVIVTGRPLVTNCPARHWASVGLPEGHPPLTSFLGVPLVQEERVMGVMALANREGGYRRHHVEALTSLAAVVAQALTRKRAEAARTRMEQELRVAHDSLEQRVKERTVELQAKNRELESFCYSVTHELGAPLRGMNCYSQILLEDYSDHLDSEGRDHLQRISAAASRMGGLVEDLLNLSRVTRRKLARERVNVSKIAADVFADVSSQYTGWTVKMEIEEGVEGEWDPALAKLVLQNLVGNAWKYSGKVEAPEIRFGSYTEGSQTVCFVRDNGIGFDMEYADKIFLPFERLHKVGEYEGTGIGLATVQRVIALHGGRIWAEAAVGEGATFYFTDGCHAC